MGRDAFGELIHRLTLDRTHRIDTWRTPGGDIVVMLMNGRGVAVQSARVPRLLSWSRWVRRRYRHLVVRRWVFTP
ncbi:MAG: hypothetical protein HOY75_08455 [Streptomyces sp.]|nr:hypothetical protein [Streptomyces sp.]